jgi:hypothetical protein
MNLTFQTWGELAQALRGQVRSGGSRVVECNMADEVINGWYVPRFLLCYIQEVINFADGATMVGGQNLSQEVKQGMQNTKGRYTFYYSKQNRRYLGNIASRSLWEGSQVMHAYGAVERAAFCADLSLLLRNFIPPDQRDDRYRRLNTQNPAQNDPAWDFVQGRGNHWGGNESSDWVKQAREHDLPLGAGPSATTMQTLAVADWLYVNGHIGAARAPQADVMKALAWGLFAFWDKADNTTMGNWKGAVHTFHEVMMVAQHYGVLYRPFAYPVRLPPLDLYL